MAVNKKGMRKVNYKGKQYFWSIQESSHEIPDEGGFVKQVQARWVRIIGSKKQFNVLYRIPEEGDTFAQLKVEGPAFPRQPNAKEIQIPRWKHDTKRYPSADFIRRLIDHCMSESGK